MPRVFFEIPPLIEEVDTIRWEQFESAYGLQEMMPQWFKQAAYAPEREHRENALNDIEDEIWHHRTYEITPIALPFLIRLLLTAGPQEQATLLEMLCLLASGPLEGWWEHKDFYGHTDDSFETYLAKCQRGETGNILWKKYQLDTYERARRAVPIILPLVASPDPYLRYRAVEFLGLFPDMVSLTRPVLMSLFRREGDIGVKQGVLQALKRLGSSKQSWLNLMNQRLEKDTSSTS